MPSSQYLQSPMPVVDSPSSQTKATRAHLRADEVCVGCVVWLPRKNGSRHVGIFGRSDAVLNATGYYHPAVILGIRSPLVPKHIGDLEICFVLLTTFSDLNISDYAIRRPSLPDSIPIVGTVKPGYSPYLHLERNVMLRKQSYVRLDNVYETNLSNLRSYNNNHAIQLPAHNWRLDKTSYHKLMSLLHLDAQEYLPTNIVKSVRKNCNASAPKCVSVPTTTQNLRSARITTCAHVSPPIQDLRNARVSSSVPDPRATQNPQNLRVTNYAPVREASWAPQFRPNSTDPIRQHYDDVLADFAIQRLQARHPSSCGAYGTYDTTMQLPLPAAYSIKRRGNWGSRKLTVKLVFSFFLFWLVMAYAGWLIWRKFGISIRD